MVNTELHKLLGVLEKNWPCDTSAHTLQIMSSNHPSTRHSHYAFIEASGCRSIHPSQNDEIKQQWQTSNTHGKHYSLFTTYRTSLTVTVSSFAGWTGSYWLFLLFFFFFFSTWLNQTTSWFTIKSTDSFRFLKSWL